MVATEELRVLIRTVADTTGARQTQQAFQQTERQIVAASQRVERALSFKDVAGAAGIGTSAAQLLGQAIQTVTAVIGGSVNASREHERVIRATAMAYGQAAGQFQEFARQLEATTGFTSDAILQAALSARTLSQNYGLTIQQTQKLITVSADLARVRGIGIAEAFERVQSAIRGEAEASEYLGLTLNDTYLTNQALNGSLKNTFGTMTDLQKAQVRYNELLRQSAQFTGLAASSANSLDAAFNRAATAAHNAEIRFGEFAKPASIRALQLYAEALNEIAKTGTNVADVKIGNFLQNLGQGLDKLRDAASGKSLADLRENSDAIADAWHDISQAGERADLSVRVAVTRISDNLADLKDRYVDVEEQARKTAAAMARAAVVDQLEAGTRDLIALQQQQNDLQRQSTQLSIEEARAKLSLLPAQQQMSALQRDITEAQLRAQQAALPATEALEDLRRAQEIARLIAQSTTDVQEAQARARLAALPPSEALDDLRYEQQRLDLVRQDRNASAAERREARAELRRLDREEEGVARAALEAQRGVTLQGRAAERVDLQQHLQDLVDQRALAAAQLAAVQAQGAQVPANRAATRVGLQAQLLDIAEQRALAPITAAQQVNQLQQAITSGLIDAQRQVLQDIAGQLTQPVTVTVNVTHEDGRVTTYTELIEASGQAQLPPIIPQSGVRR